MPIGNVLKERDDFQQLILEHLRDDNGYIIRKADNFNRQYAMDTEVLLSFLEDTQPEAIEKLRKIYKEKADEIIIKHINDEIIKKNSSLLNILKHGVWFDNGTKLELMYRKPASGYNPKATELYAKNRFSVMEEVYHKEGERIDLVIFLNGIAIISFELKCNTSGQDYKDAIWQYKNDRDYKTRLFMFKAGCLVNFAMDLNEVYMCTELKGKASFFLPFNKGSEDMGKGNPHNEEGINVAYMWEDILKKDILIFLIEKFIFIKHEEKEDPKTGKIKVKEALIFPRYHQLDVIRKLEADISENRTECNYLIQHSAGSGKTNSIAWLSHRLVPLRDKEDKSIFDTIIIITDRIVVDRQLQDAILGIEHKSGLVQVMDDKSTSSDLADALNGNTKIVVSTIQKFRFIIDQLRDMKDKTFAVIIDEAHSSTAGKNMAAVTTSLSANKEAEDEEGSIEDMISEEISRNGKQNNISMIAFTATPKPTTLSLFGRLNGDGKPEAFHLYSMKQAIEEGFILDVLQNYVTYETFYKLNKEVENDPILKTSDAKRKINRFVELNDTNIGQKVEIIVEHFRTCIMKELGGKAKAMVVTSSREAAVKYRNAFEAYIKAQGYDDIHALVAFSGKVSSEGKEYTEAGMNGFPEDKLRDEFDKDDYQVLLVANKYQTGFDQPKLMAMYVDKKLKDIAAVQTLSRLNRIYPPYDKTTFILDFKNSYEDIQTAFAPYYKETILGETITPSEIYTLEKNLDEYRFLFFDDIATFNDLVYKEKRTAKEKEKMWSILDKSLKVISQFDLKKQIEIKKAIKKFIRFYTFLIQVTSFEDVDLHKKYNYLTYLVKEIDITGGGNGFDIEGKVSASNFQQKKTGEHTTSDLKSNPILHLTRAGSVNIDEQKMARLSEIIDEINNSTGKKLDVPVAAKSLLQIKDILLKSEALQTSARSNGLKDFGFSYYDSIDNALIEGFNQNQDFFTLLLDKDDVKKRVMSLFLEDVYKELRGNTKAKVIYTDGADLNRKMVAETHDTYMAQSSSNFRGKNNES